MRIANLAYIALLGFGLLPLDTHGQTSGHAIQLDLELNEKSTSAPFARTGVITKESQFVAGNLADAWLGDFFLETDKFRAVIARPDKPSIGQVGGGSLMDLIIGSKGVDYLGSLNTSIDPASTSSVVIYDKALPPVIEKNTTATISLQGHVALPASDKIAIKVNTRYSATKGSSLLTIISGFTNVTSDPVWIRPSDIIDWGESRVFAEGHGFAPTSSSAVYAIGTLDDFSATYYTAGTHPLQGLHSRRDSVILAVGTPGNLPQQPAARKTANPNADKLPREFSEVGASIQALPGMVMFPGTESRYVSDGFGSPRKEPIYVPPSAIRYEDGKATVSRSSVRSSFQKNPAPEHEASYVKLLPGETFNFKRYISVGSGDWGLGVKRAWEEKKSNTGILAGAVVEDKTAGRIAGATVRISGSPGWNGDGSPPPALQVKTRDDGTFIAHVPPGKYLLSAAATGRTSIEGKAVMAEVHAGTTVTAVGLTMTQLSHLRVAVSEAETPTSSPLPVKLTIISKPPYQTVNYGLNPDVKDGVRNTRYLPYGAGIIPVTPGRYQVIISRGIEYDIIERDIEVQPGQDITLIASLPHVMKGLLPSMVSMDAGVVTSRSGSGYADAESRVIQAACEGVQLLVSGDYDHVTDLETAVSSLRLEKWVKAFPGRRILLSKGNLSADVFIYPLAEKTSQPLAAALDKVKDIPPDIALADLKKEFPSLIFEISRPLHPEAGYLNAFPFDDKLQKFKDNALPPPDFNALQLVEGKRLGQYPDVYPRNIQLQLNRFAKGNETTTTLAASGSSLSRLSYGQEIGYPRTYLYLDAPKPLTDITASDIASAVLNQRFMVTNGPILLFDALDQQTRKFSIRPGQMVDLKTTEICHIRARVLAAPWITLSGLTSKENGLQGITVMINKASRNVSRYPGENAGQGSNIFAREINKDTILEATAFSDRRSLAPVVPDTLEDFGGPVYPFAWSGPIFVDRDGDGKILIDENPQ